MIIIWRGFGILVPIILVICILVTIFLVEYIFQDHYYTNKHNWPFMLGFIIAALIIWLLGRNLNRKGKEIPIEQITIDTIENTPSIPSYHTLFFIPMEYWSIVLIFIGLLIQFLPQKDKPDYQSGNLYKNDLVIDFKSDSDSLIYSDEEKKGIRLSVILVKTKIESDKILKKLNEGGKFADLSKQYSIGPGRERGGDIGFIIPGDMIKGLNKIAEQLQVGEYSNPIETHAGFFILLKTDERGF